MPPAKRSSGCSQKRSFPELQWVFPQLVLALDSGDLGTSGLPQPHFLLLLLFSCSVMSDSVTPWTAARQAAPSFMISWSLLKLMSIEFSSCLQSFPASGSFQMSQSTRGRPSFPHFPSGSLHMPLILIRQKADRRNKNYSPTASRMKTTITEN